MRKSCIGPYRRRATLDDWRPLPYAIWTTLFGSRKDRLNQRFHAIGHNIARNALEKKGGMDTEEEAQKVSRLLARSTKPRDVSAYRDVADHLLAHYEPSVAYFVAVDIDLQMRSIVGYIPIGQIALAVEQTSQPDRVEQAADFLTCALMNLGNIEMARQRLRCNKVTSNEGEDCGKAASIRW